MGTPDPIELVRSVPGGIMNRPVLVSTMNLAKHGHGDSGGGWFSKSKKTGEYVLIGITSGTLGHPGNKKHQFASPTGDVFSLDHGTWIANRIGRITEEDGDGDGIPDFVDNCVDVYNPGQEDDDEDGVGDACDNCTQALVDDLALRGNVYARLFSAFNPSQKDSDGDGIGDVCDLCPFVRSATNQLAPFPEQKDRDGDGVGDQCDSCYRFSSPVKYECNADLEDACGIRQAGSCVPGDIHGKLAAHCSGEEYSPCVVPDRTCQRLSLGVCGGADPGELGRCSVDGSVLCVVSNDTCAHSGEGYCVGESENASGHCSLPPDRDGDGVSDACDACPDVPDPDQRNSNYLIEVALNRSFPAERVARILGDACDPVPLTRINEPRSIVTAGRTTIAPFTSIDQVIGGWSAASREWVQGDSWLGPPATNPGPTMHSTFFRHCGCFDEAGIRAKPEDCARRDADCDPGRVVQPKGFGGGWVPVVLHDPQDSHVSTSSPLNQEFMEGESRPFPPLVWDWYSATLPSSADRIQSRLVSVEGEVLVGTYGLLASTVAPVSNLFGREEPAGYHSDRDEARHFNGIRTVVQVYETPNYALEALPSLDALYGCTPPLCLRLLPSFEARIRWPDAVRYPPDGGVLAVNRLKQVVIERGGDSILLRDEAIGAGLREAIANPRLRWIPSLESGRSLLRLGADRPGVFLFDEGVQASRPLVLMSTSDGLSIEDHGSPFLLPEGAPRRAAVSIPVGGRAIFSAIENSVYVVGGASLSDLGLIRRYDLEAETWSRIAVEDFSPAAEVLGVAYSPSNGVIYVLDRDGDSARLVAHDLRESQSWTLWATSFTSEYWLTSISVNEFSELLLLGAAESSFTVCRFGLEGRGAKVFGVSTREGRIADVPVMGMDSLILPVWRSEGIRLEPAEPSAYESSVACPNL